MDDVQIQDAPTAVDNVARVCVTSVDDSHTAEDVEDTCPLTALKRIRTCVRYLLFEFFPFYNKECADVQSALQFIIVKARLSTQTYVCVQTM